MYFNYLLFRNRVRPDINALYALYHRLAMVQRTLSGRRFDPERCADAKRFGTDGFHLFRTQAPVGRIKEIAAKVDKLLCEQEAREHDKELPITRLTNCLTLCPDVEELLDARLVGTVEAFFKSEAHLLRTEIYRLHPSRKDVGHSWLWHFDNVPAQIVKAMVYLTDCDRYTGALSVVPRPKSLALQDKGFWDRHAAGPFEQELREPNNHVVAEGDGGTVVLFSAHYCIHKATAPKQGVRDVVVFTFQPSFRPLPARLPESREQDVQRAYHANPFTGRLMKEDA